MVEDDLFLANLVFLQLWCSAKHENVNQADAGVAEQLTSQEIHPS